MTLTQEMEYHAHGKESVAACVQKNKTTESKQRRLYLYQRAVPSLSLCSAWPWIKRVQYSKYNLP